MTRPRYFTLRDERLSAAFLFVFPTHPRIKAGKEHSDVIQALNKVMHKLKNSELSTLSKTSTTVQCGKYI